MITMREYLLPRTNVFPHYRNSLPKFMHYHGIPETTIIMVWRGELKFFFQNCLISLVFWWQDKSYSGQNLRSILSLAGTFFFTTCTVFPISIQWGFSFVKPRGLISNQPLLLKRTQSPAVALAWFRIKITMDRIVKFCPKYIRLFVFQNTDVSF